MNPQFREDPPHSYSLWPRRYLLFGPILAIVQILLFYALFITGIGMSDSAPQTPGKDRAMDVISVIILVMEYPLRFISTGRISGDEALGILMLNALIWGLCTVGIWHILSAFGNRLRRKEKRH